MAPGGYGGYMAALGGCSGKDSLAIGTAHQQSAASTLFTGFRTQAHYSAVEGRQLNACTLKLRLSVGAPSCDRSCVLFVGARLIYSSSAGWHRAPLQIAVI